MPNKAVVTRALRQLRCIDEDAGGKRWVWRYTDEAEPLTFGRPRSEFPPMFHPVALGRFRFLPGRA